MPKLTFVLVGVALFALAGCGSKKKVAADTTAKMAQFKDALCKCKAGDFACANKVIEDQRTWIDEMAKNEGIEPDPELVAELTRKMEPIMAEYNKCMTAAMTPAAAPQPETPAITQ